ncbi:MAG: TetR/AcrR family transcriptional regulator [Dehalococcoidia bacterium]|nr:TetR/AcrR family transcriptional regulator [Dehalococcoidia bacterium]
MSAANVSDHLPPADGPCAVERGKHGKEGRQRALMEAARAVFAEHGYDAATTREVAERANCSEGLIHRYFQGKRGLLLAILAHDSEDFASRMLAEMPETDSLEHDVRQMLLWALDAMWEKRDFMRVSVSRSAVDPEIGHVIGHHLNSKRVELIARKLRQHQDAGRLRPDVDCESVAYAITGINLAAGFFCQAVFSLDRADVRRMTEETARVIARGIAIPTDAGEGA